jgi:hypothetical protein
MEITIDLKPGNEEYYTRMQKLDQACIDCNYPPSFYYYVYGIDEKTYIITHGREDGSFVCEDQIINDMIKNDNMYLVCCYPVTVKKSLYKMGYRKLSKRVIIPVDKEVYTASDFIDESVYVLIENNIMYIEDGFVVEN